jgi:hypothetical protein
MNVSAYDAMFYLKDKGFRYLFKCFNEGSRCNFWVFDFDETKKVYEKWVYRKH